MPSYYYSSYLQDVSVGTPLAVVETFRIPAEVLTSGQAITLTNAQIPEMDQLILSTEDLVLCQVECEVAQAADSLGMTGSRLCAPRPIRKPPSRSAKRSMAALGTVTLTGSPIRLPFPSPATSPSPTRRKPSPGHTQWNRGTSPARSTAPAGWWRFPTSGRRMGASTWISSPSLTSGRGNGDAPRIPGEATAPTRPASRGGATVWFNRITCRSNASADQKALLRSVGWPHGSDPWGNPCWI